MTNLSLLTSTIRRVAPRAYTLQGVVRPGARTFGDRKRIVAAVTGGRAP